MELAPHSTANLLHSVIFLITASCLACLSSCDQESAEQPLFADAEPISFCDSLPEFIEKEAERLDTSADHLKIRITQPGNGSTASADLFSNFSLLESSADKPGRNGELSVIEATDSTDGTIAILYYFSICPKDPATGKGMLQRIFLLPHYPSISFLAYATPTCTGPALVPPSPGLRKDMLVEIAQTKDAQVYRLGDLSTSPPLLSLRPVDKSTADYCVRLETAISGGFSFAPYTSRHRYPLADIMISTY